MMIKFTLEKICYRFGVKPCLFKKIIFCEIGMREKKKIQNFLQQKENEINTRKKCKSGG